MVKSNLDLTINSQTKVQMTLTNFFGFETRASVIIVSIRTLHGSILHVYVYLQLRDVNTINISLLYCVIKFDELFISQR